MISWLVFFIIWIVSGHLIYITIMNIISPLETIKEIYKVDTFVFVSITGPLILLFHD